jgi:hypothetical protein
MPSQRAHDRVISAEAARSHGVVTRAALVRLGVPETVIDERVQTRQLLVIHRGVYALGHAELRREGWWVAAVESYKSRGVLSHVSAGALWDIHDAPTFPIHVSLVGRSGARRRRGVVPHRPEDLPPEEITVVRAVRVTTVARTILDLAATVRGRHLEQVVRRAARRRIFDLAGQRAVLERHPRQPGAPELGRLLAVLHGRGTDDFRSPMEIAFEFHAMPTAFADDRRRDQKLTLAGYTVVRLTWDQVRAEARATARTISALLSQCRPTLTGQFPVDVPGKLRRPAPRPDGVACTGPAARPP